ncbi:DinB family protein [Paenibacillus elgii]|uniref:DinB family protein n=1 Tax=Paenibacillus elgii TaxID=189691 RepID=UPI00203DA2AA|nr:DinB family protein [Paenibacillus elgii]MCM3267613.1 DinB family protein [Paenibacillus elgii]
MNTAETVQRMEEITNRYIQELDDFSMEQLIRKPSENEWSLGQMYVHLINSALNMQLRNIELCRQQSANEAAEAEGKTEAGEAIFRNGSFPPVRIQVQTAVPDQPLTKQQIVEGLNTVVRRMKEVEPLLEEISPRHTVQHPRLGGLNAKEWFELVEMHYRHHLHQKERLKAYLESNE